MGFTFFYSSFPKPRLSRKTSARPISLTKQKSIIQVDEDDWFKLEGELKNNY